MTTLSVARTFGADRGVIERNVGIVCCSMLVDPA